MMVKFVEIIRFKDTGKYYETVEISVPEIIILDHEIHSFIREHKKNEECNKGWI